MKLNFMRFLDRVGGKAIIIVLVFVKYVLGIFRRRRSKTLDLNSVKTVLVQKYFGFGSIINSFPLLEILTKQIPHARIIFLTFDRNREVFKVAGMAHEVITVNSESFVRFGVECLKAIVRLNRLGVDVSIDCEFFSRFSMIMSFLSGAPVRSGFFSYFNIRSSLLTHPTAFNHYKHISRAFLSMVEVLGLEVPESDYKVSLPRIDGGERNKLYEIIGNPDRLPVLTINTNASTLCAMRKWPAARYVELVDRLMERYSDYMYVLIGSKSEFDYVESIYQRCRNTNGRLVNAAGKTNFRELLALLEDSELLISNDSGPVHLAAAYETNTVVMFGPETPVLYRPLNDNVRVLYRDIYCSPCINVLDNKSFEECADVKCMEEISVDEVIEAAESFLAKGNNG